MRNSPRAGAGGHQRRNRGQAAIKSTREYRVTATWPEGTGQPLVYGTRDKAKARKVGRTHAEAGAYVTIEEHVEFGTYRLVQTVDGPAMAAEREAADRAAADAARAAEEAAHGRVRAELARRAAQRRAEVHAARDRAQAAALMRQPDHVLPAAQQRARHTAGGR